MKMSAAACSCIEVSYSAKLNVLILRSQSLAVTLDLSFLLKRPHSYKQKPDSTLSYNLNRLAIAASVGSIKFICLKYFVSVLIFSKVARADHLYYNRKRPR